MMLALKALTIVIYVDWTEQNGQSIETKTALTFGASWIGGYSQIKRYWYRRCWTRVVDRKFTNCCIESGICHFSQGQRWANTRVRNCPRLYPGFSDKPVSETRPESEVRTRARVRVRNGIIPCLKILFCPSPCPYPSLLCKTRTWSSLQIGLHACPSLLKFFLFKTELK